MGMPEYRQVIEQICRQAAVISIDAASTHEAMTINGIPVWFQYIEPADLCRVVVDLGAPDNGIPESALRTMLECNCSSTSVVLPFIGINPTDGHAILMLHMPIPMLQKDFGLFDELQKELVNIVNVWRKLFEISHSMDSERKISFPNLNHA